MKNGPPGNRTPNLLIKRLLFYPFSTRRVQLYGPLDHQVIAETAFTIDNTKKSKQPRGTKMKFARQYASISRSGS